ncbi:MAG: LysR family transcriptional regulator [Lachnospiraceae bacterium]|jgi:molybdate transport system regulatory protein|nr:LysR family transcriptional regulator [Lachnospiraceae bacterium]
MKYHIKLTLYKEEREYGFGPGTCELLERVEVTRSLNQAAKDMGMSYSKAWKSLKNTEENLGIQLLIRKGPQGSILSKEGSALVRLYQNALLKAESVIEQEVSGS